MIRYFLQHEDRPPVIFNSIAQVARSLKKHYLSAELGQSFWPARTVRLKANEANLNKAFNRFRYDPITKEMTQAYFENKQIKLKFTYETKSLLCVHYVEGTLTEVIGSHFERPLYRYSSGTLRGKAYGKGPYKVLDFNFKLDVFEKFVADNWHIPKWYGESYDIRNTFQSDKGEF